MASNILLAHASQVKVPFDPKNQVHLAAAKLLLSRDTSRQHPTLRFVLEHPYVDVRQMMMVKIAQTFLDGI